jgi:hypothetical protein
MIASQTLAVNLVHRKREREREKEGSKDEKDDFLLRVCV